MSTFKEIVNEFITRERIERVRSTGNPEHKPITTTFDQLEIKDRDWKGVTQLHYLQNSFLNRPLNIGNPSILLDKIRYAIEIIAGTASIGEVPTSYIHTLEEDDESPRLYMKDRGHIVHVLHKLGALMLTRDEWREIISLLGDCRDSSLLIQIRDTIETTAEAMDDTTKISVKDMIGAEIYRRLMNLEITIKVSIESLKNHVREMDKINNSNNGWTSHNYGMLELKSLDSRTNPMIDADLIYKEVLKSEVMQSKEAFLKGRFEWCQKSAGHEDEVLYYFVGAWEVYDDDEDFKNRFAAYEKVTDIPLRKKLYTTLYDNSVDTDALLESLEFMHKVGMTSDWRRLVQYITTLANLQDKGTTNLKALTPQQQRSAMKYLDILKVLSKKTKWSGNMAALVKIVVDEAMRMLHVPKDTNPLDNSILFALKEDGTSAVVRHDQFFIPLYQNCLKKIKGDKKNRGARAAKTDKLAVLSGVLAEGNMPEAFTVMDRHGEDEFRLTYINVATGDGLQLGHILPGREFTEENTFLQFEKDNNWNKDRTIPTDYWTQYMTWVTAVWKDSTDNRDLDAYQNTIQLCKLLIAHGQLI